MNDDTKQCLIVCVAALAGFAALVTGIVALNQVSNNYWQPIAIECTKNGGTFTDNRCYWGRK